MIAPRTMNARRARIRTILEVREVASQAELGQLLAAEGIEATQATLSRDLDAIGAIKATSADGHVRYVVPGDATPRIDPGVDGVARLAAELLLSAEPAMNMAVLRTPPGGAMYLAGSLDRSGTPEVVGTVAGDDTVFVVTRSEADAASLCRRLLQLADRRTLDEDRTDETRKTS
jgi:transcriptional regulator of arginine metabolism